jgi:plasmid stabilization system protein ParE
LTPRVVFHPQARTELLEARDWYERRVPGLGAEFTRTVDGAVTAIANFPNGFAKVYADFRQCALRRFPYSIVYRQRATELVVIAVFHQRRNPDAWRKRPV